MPRVTLQGFQCERCGHKWYPREEGEPRVCPKCKSPYWDRPRRLSDLHNRPKLKDLHRKESLIRTK